MVTQPEIDVRRTNLRASAVSFPDDPGYPDYASPGEYQRLDTHVLLACPGCGRVAGMRVGSPKPERSPSWLWTDGPNGPTMWPSINCTGCCGWHGFLSDGLFTTA